MPTALNACAPKASDLLVQLDRAHRSNDVAAAQKILNALYTRFDSAVAMANTFDGATA